MKINRNQFICSLNLLTSIRKDIYEDARLIRSDSMNVLYPQLPRERDFLLS